MAKIYSPNKDYTGVSASVSFCSGVGNTNDRHLIQWFEEHGYQVKGAKTERKASGQQDNAEDPGTEELSVDVKEGD